MTADELFVLIRDYFVSEFELDPSAITLQADLYETLALDSIDALDLVAMLEAKTGLSLEEAELRKIRNIQHVIDLIQSRLQ